MSRIFTHAHILLTKMPHLPLDLRLGVQCVGGAGRVFVYDQTHIVRGAERYSATTTQFNMHITDMGKMVGRAATIPFTEYQYEVGLSGAESGAKWKREGKKLEIELRNAEREVGERRQSFGEWKGPIENGSMKKRVHCFEYTLEVSTPFQLPFT